VILQIVLEDSTTSSQIFVYCNLTLKLISWL